MRRRPKKKTKTTKWQQPGVMVLVGCGILLIIVLIVANAGSPKKSRPPRRPAQTARVPLSERQKREVYRSLFALKGMLRGAGGNPQRSYQVLADRYKVSTGAIRAVEAEGRQKGWPKSGS